MTTETAELQRGFFKRIGQTLDDRINPIVVKELRQAVKGRFVSLILVLFPLLAVTIVGLALLTAEPGSLDSGRGRETFMWIYCSALFTCMVMIPSFVGARMAFERNGENLDLLYVTPLTAGAIVRGKAFSGLVLVLVSFSACLPFMTLTYLLRGIDVLSILLIVGLGALTTIASVFFSILIAAVPGSRALKFLLGLFGFGGLITLFGYTVAFSGFFLFEGRGSPTDHWEFWAAIATLVGVVFFASGFMAACSKACIMPPSANRALSIRVWATVSWLYGLVVCYLWTWAQEEPDLFLVWEILAITLLTFLILGAISERDSTGPRLAGSIPSTAPGRFGAFLFFSGAGGGITWCLILFAATMLIPLQGLNVGLSSSSYSHRYDNYVHQVYLTSGFGLYILAYALTASLLHRHLLARWVRPGTTWAVALGLFGFMLIAPILIILLGYRNLEGIDDHMGLFLLTPVVLGDHATRDLGWTTAMFCALFATLFSLPWIVRQFTGFRPLKPRSRPHDPSVPQAEGTPDNG